MGRASQHVMYNVMYNKGMPSDPTLPPVSQRIWELRTEGRSVSAIAKLVEEPEDRVRWLLQRSMERLDKSDPLGRLPRPARRKSVA